MTVQTSISLTDQQEAFARRLVEAGRYPSLSAVLQHGLELLRQETEAKEVETEALRALLRRRAQGPFLSVEEFERRTDHSLAEQSARFLRDDIADDEDL